MAVDLAAALRRRKPEKRSQRLAVRDAGDRTLASARPSRIPALMPDTCVYIDAAADRLPVEAKALLETAAHHHSSVSLGEIAVGLGNMPPHAPGYRASRAYYTALMRAIPSHRVLVPDENDWLEAGILAGVVARVQTLAASQRKEVLNDALIYVSAAKAGLAVLTADLGFDLLQQLHPAGSVVFY